MINLAFGRFELRRFARNPGVWATSVLLPAALFALNAHDPNGAIAHIAWKPYFLGSMIAYAAMTAAIVIGPQIATERASGWTHQLRATPLRPSDYVGAKVVVSLAAGVLTAAVIVIEGVALGTLPVGRVGIVAVAMLAGSVPFAGIGLVLGYVLRPRSLQMVMAAVILALAFLGGLFVPTVAMPAWLRAASPVLPSYHLGAISRAAAAGTAVPAKSVAVLGLYAAGAFALGAWRYRHDDDRPVPQAAG